MSNKMVWLAVCVLEHNERQKKNPDLRGDSMELCSKGRLLGVRPKSHNVPHRLEMGRLMSL